MILLLIKLILINQLTRLLMLSITKTGIIFNANSEVILHNIFQQNFSRISQKNSRCDGIQKKIAVVDVENADSEITEENNLEDLNDFHLEYNEATNISTFQETSRTTIAGGSTNVPIINSCLY